MRLSPAIERALAEIELSHQPVQRDESFEAAVVDLFMSIMEQIVEALDKVTLDEIVNAAGCEGPYLWQPRDADGNRLPPPSWGLNQ